MVRDAILDINMLAVRRGIHNPEARGSDPAATIFFFFFCLFVCFFFFLFFVFLFLFCFVLFCFLNIIKLLPKQNNSNAQHNTRSFFFLFSSLKNNMLFLPVVGI